MSPHADGTAGETEQTVSAVLVEPVLELDPQNHPHPKRKPPQTALSARYKVTKQESTYMPAMSTEAALARRAAIVDFTRKIMVRDQDFGEIPGTHKPALLKPGAEKLCNFFGLEPEFTPVVEEIDWTGAKHGGETFCYVRYRCRLFRQNRILGVGEGSCNSWESRYRYLWVNTEQIRDDIDRTQLLKRGGSRTCSEFEFAIDRAETTGVYGKPAEYWKNFAESIRAGTARRVERDSRQGKLPAWEIDIDTTLYRIPNPDVADLVNTIQKMAQKRALVAATLIATSASEFFTQDIEDTSQGETFRAIPEGEGRTHWKRVAEELVDGNALQEHTTASDNVTHPIRKPWKNFGEMRKHFEHMRERVGETKYFEEMEIAGVKSPVQFKSANKAMECYSRLVRVAESEVA
jgi:hypothetical protein